MVPPPAQTQGKRVLVSDTTPAAVRDALQAKGHETALASGGAISIAPLLPGVCAGLRFSNRLSPTGISVRGRVGLLIAREAGAVVGSAEGGAFPEGLDEPADTLVVARDADIAARVQRAAAAR